MATNTMFFPLGITPDNYNPPIPGFDYMPGLGDLLDLHGFGIVTQNTTLLDVELNNGLRAQFVGTGFTYDPDDTTRVTGGTLNTIHLLLNDGTTAQQDLTGLTLSLQNVLDFAVSVDTWTLGQWLMNGNDTINGSAGGDDIEGQGGNDTLIGNDGDDYIDGHGGTNTYDGGAGFDELSYEGSSWGSGILHGVTINTITGTAINAFGNAETFTNFEAYRGTSLVDTFTGSGADEQFMGLGGRDIIDGGGGVDEVRYDRDANRGGNAGVYVDLTDGVGYDGFGNKDTLSNIENARGTNFADTLIGTIDTHNLLRGLGGADILDSQFGNIEDFDEMWGGAGNDTYVVHDASDFIDENADNGGGNDTVESWIDFSLSDAGQIAGAVENLTLLDVVVTGTGNGLNNVLRGNAVANVLSGLGGNDVLYGLGGADTLFGNGGNDTLVGGAGNDTMNGGGGVDTVNYALDGGPIGVRVNLLGSGSQGGLAHDTARDSFGNTDTVAGIPNVVGTRFADAIYGGNNANNLNGGAGNDTLLGGRGIDVLTGGLGSDNFIFNAPLSAANRDTITDFNHVADTFKLENAVMTTLGAGVHALAAGMFRNGAAAADANDHIIYNHANGYLSYDSNGNGAGGVTLLAILTNRPVLAANDFTVI